MLITPQSHSRSSEEQLGFQTHGFHPCRSSSVSQSDLFARIAAVPGSERQRQKEQERGHIVAGR